MKQWVSVLLAGCLGAVLTFSLMSRMPRPDNQKVRAQNVSEAAATAGWSVADTFYKAEGPELEYALSQAAAEHAIAVYSAQAKSKKEVEFLDLLSAKVAESSRCRAFMTTASIETLRINESCYKQGARLLASQKADIADIAAGK